LNNANNNVVNASNSVGHPRGILNTNTVLGNRIGFVGISLGVLVAACSGSWDITNHLLNKPETFFSAPHAGLYAGVALVVFALVCVLRFNRANQHDHVDYSKSFLISKLIDRQKPPLALAIKLIIAGVGLLAIAGPLDFGWHSAFGLDGLLSPSHFILAMGLVLSSSGALLGTLSMNELVSLHNKVKAKVDPASFSSRSDKRRDFNDFKLSLLIVVGIVPVWIALVGLVHMLSLPFSETISFNFNPDPNLAAIFVTLALPLLVSFILTASFRLTRNFGIITIIGSAFVTVNLVTLIYPNEFLHSTILFYVLNIIPFIAVDLALNKFEGSRSKIFVYGVSGAVLGVTFFLIHYPLITYTYNEVLPNSEPVWPSITISTYFGMVETIYPLLLLPGLSSGFFGAILALRFGSTKF
jgi:hypothetical protein